MDSKPEGGCGETASDISVALITVAQLIFLAFFHRYIAWYTTAPDGSATRISLLTEDYPAWLPFPIAASIVVIVASIVMIVYGRYWFRQAAWIGFSILGIAVTVSAVCIFPFDFSAIPNATVAAALPRWVTVFLIFMAAFYGICALVLSVKLIRDRKGARS